MNRSINNAGADVLGRPLFGAATCRPCWTRGFFRAAVSAVAVLSLMFAMGCAEDGEEEEGGGDDPNITGEWSTDRTLLTGDWKLVEYITAEDGVTTKTDFSSTSNEALFFTFGTSYLTAISLKKIDGVWHECVDVVSNDEVDFFQNTGGNWFRVNGNNLEVGRRFYDDTWSSDNTWKFVKADYTTFKNSLGTVISKCVEDDDDDGSTTNPSALVGDWLLYFGSEDPNPLETARMYMTITSSGYGCMENYGKENGVWVRKEVDGTGCSSWHADDEFLYNDVDKYSYSIIDNMLLIKNGMCTYLDGTDVRVCFDVTYIKANLAAFKDSIAAVGVDDDGNTVCYDSDYRRIRCIPGGSNSGSIVLPYGQAWTMCDNNDDPEVGEFECLAYFFNVDGNITSAAKLYNNDVWYDVSDFIMGHYQIIGNTNKIEITIITDDYMVGSYTWIAQYVISGDTLTLYDQANINHVEVYTRTSGIYPQTPPSDWYGAPASLSKKRMGIGIAKSSKR